MRWGETWQDRYHVALDSQPRNNSSTGAHALRKTQVHSLSSGGMRAKRLIRWGCSNPFENHMILSKTSKSGQWHDWKKGSERMQQSAFFWKLQEVEEIVPFRTRTALAKEKKQEVIVTHKSSGSQTGNFASGWRRGKIVIRLKFGLLYAFKHDRG